MQSHRLLQLVTGITLTTNLDTPAKLVKFQTAIVTSVANILNLYALNGSVSTPVVTASSRRELLQSGVNVAYVGMFPFPIFSLSLSFPLINFSSSHIHLFFLTPFISCRTMSVTYPLVPQTTKTIAYGVVTNKLTTAIIGGSMTSTLIGKEERS